MEKTEKRPRPLDTHELNRQMECLYQAAGTCDCQEFARVDDATPPSSSLLKNAMIQGVDAVASQSHRGRGPSGDPVHMARIISCRRRALAWERIAQQCIIPWFHSVPGFTMLTIPAIMIVWRRQGSWHVVRPGILPVWLRRLRRSVRLNVVPAMPRLQFEGLWSGCDRWIFFGAPT